MTARGHHTIAQAQDDLWGAVEAGDEVRRDVVVPNEHSTAKVADLYEGSGGGDKDVIRLDVRMQNAAVPQVVERAQHLGRVRAHSVDVEPDALAILFGELPQVDILRVGTILLR